MSHIVASCSHNVVACAAGSCSLRQEVKILLCFPCCTNEVKSTGSHFCFRLLVKQNHNAKYYRWILSSKG